MSYAASHGLNLNIESMVNHGYFILVNDQPWTRGQSPWLTMDQRTKSMVNHGPEDRVHGQPWTREQSPWSTTDN